MTYIDYLNQFNLWLESNALPSSSQLMYYKLLHVFNRAGWPETVQVDNRRMMLMTGSQAETTIIRARDRLVDAGFIRYEKGRKGAPNRYALSKIYLNNESISASESASISASISASESASISASHIKTKKKTKKKKELSCPEQAPLASVPEEPPVIFFPLNDGTEYPVSRGQCQKWEGLYPAVDVMQQLRSMKGWLDANPKKRKTKSGIARFVNGWLAKEQNRGGTPGYVPPEPEKDSTPYGTGEMLPDTQRVHLPENATLEDILNLIPYEGAEP